MGTPTPIGPQRQQAEREVDIFVELVRQEMLEQVKRGGIYAGIDLSRAAAQEVVAKLPVANPWPKIVGPCYTSGSLQRELGIGRAAVSKAVRERRLLRLDTEDGATLYPAFQIRGRRMVPHLDLVLRELSAGFDSPLMWAQWLNVPVPRPNGQVGRRIDELAAGKVTELVLEAKHTAAVWAA